MTDLSVRRARRFLWIAMITLVALLASCGYHTAGNSSHLPVDVKILAIPSFSNQTHTYHVETGLTEGSASRSTCSLTVASSRAANSS